jgi:hypothetical protein
MSNPPSSNYIKVKSRKKLRKEILDSKQAILKAGSNDIDNQPGSTSISGPISNPTGVHQPNTITTNVQFGETYTSHVGGMGVGSVEGPPEKPRDSLSSNDTHYPYTNTQKWRQMNKQVEHPANLIPQSGMIYGSNDNQPVGTTGAGSLTKQPDRTTAKDPERRKRYKKRKDGDQSQ